MVANFNLVALFGLGMLGFVAAQCQFGIFLFAIQHIFPRFFPGGEKDFYEN